MTNRTRTSIISCVLGLLLAGWSLLLAGCGDESNGNGDADAEADADADAPDPTDVPETHDPAAEEIPQPDVEPDVEEEDAAEEEAPGPGALAFTTNAAFDYSSGSYSVILDDMGVVADAAAVHADAVVRCTAAGPVILERFGADTVTLIEPADPYGIAGQFSVGSGSNPVDMAVLSSGRALVTRNNETTAALVDLAAGEMVQEAPDLAAFADDDGIPEMAGLFVHDGKIFIGLQLLDRDTEWWDPSGPGLIVVVDETTLEPLDTDTATADVDGITLSAPNPMEGMQASPADAGLLLVAEVGFYGAQDGGIEAVSMTTYDGAGWVVTEETLGGDITAWVVVDGSTGYAAVSKPSFAGDKLVRFNPSDGTVTADSIIETAAFTLTAVALTDDGRLLVADRTLESAGVRIFNAETAEEQSGSPLSVGLAPFSICAP
jgi:hypothetical protein